ncbi:copper resistance CopC family protein [Kurthia senegalensis]|uniref:copper resistance CopC family protein n=1 Tax=Kurthia senegalensis TaxID=1033740 RepID=UPI000287D4F9|nr:copper resistance protein CopC [Kurthia senegalensis]
MKRFISAAALAALLTTMGTPAFAHSEMSSSSPKDGETVTTQLDEISLSFAGKIEKGSSIEVTEKDGKKVAIEKIDINKEKLTATFEEPLENNEYTVDWDVISGDGHPLEGNYSFTVNAPEEVKTTTEEKTAEKQTEKQEQVKETPKKDTSEDVTSPSTGMLISVFGGIIILIAAGMFFLFRKK